ncbi:YjbH domain-containing protein [Salinivibrio costicola]|uniref:YjbH domain-containing protein n=1 Tax=Salinivibrio costicola TaxID=51367 RepID=UPI003F6FF525
MKRAVLTCSAIVISTVSASPSQADDFSYPALHTSQMDFGGVGLMQMPSARHAPEGEFSVGVTHNDDYIHYHASLQLFPWLETTVRYTQVYDVLYSSNPDFSDDNSYTDKSIDAKLTLLEESYWLPALSVGVRDIGGTGLFDGEYIAGSKRAGPFDFTLGVGWGYLGNRANLRGDKSQGSDCDRNTGYKGNGGNVDLERMFSGCVSLFGGVAYQTPWAPLSLKLEYDGNDYRSDFPTSRAGTPLPSDSAWNLGMVYRLTPWADLRVSYERANTLTAGLTLANNFNHADPFWLDEPMAAYQPAATTDTLSERQWQQLSEQLATQAGYQDNRVSYNGEQVTVTGKQTKYRDRAEAHDRAARLIANTGIDAKRYHVIETNQRQALTETVIDAERYAQVARHDYLGASIDDASGTVSAGHTFASGPQVSDQLDTFNAGFAPKLRQSIGGSEDFYLYALGLTGQAEWRMNDHWLASGAIYANITDNYDKFNYTVPPDGTDLKRVRTLTRQYLDETFRVTNLQLTYLDRFSDHWYTQAYGGYLEDMFAGVGGEVLYRPFDSPFALGVDINYVKQRRPGSVFGLFEQELQYSQADQQSYRVQTGTATGHATLYWQEPLGLFDGTLAKISAGRYLTDDVGVTLDASKQFDSGIIAGVFATKTDLSAEEFGEGSFTKGFYISIPFDLLSVKPSTQRANISWMPLQRDGGQQLGRKYPLYELTDPRSPWQSRPIQ